MSRRHKHGVIAGGILTARADIGEGHWWRSGLIMLAAILVLPTFGLLAVNHLTRDALRTRARTANEQLAAQQSSFVKQTLLSRWNLVAAAARPSAASMSSATGVAADLGTLAAAGDFCQVYLTQPGDPPIVAHSVSHCPAGVTAAGVPSSVTSASLPVHVVHGVAYSGFVENLSPGADPAQLIALFTEASVIGPLQAGRGITVSAITDYGMDVASTNRSLPGRMALSKPLLALVHRHQPGSLSDFSPRVKANVLISYQPIPGTALGISVSVRDATAYAAANSLQRDLWWGYGVFALVALGVTIATSLAMQRREAARRLAMRNASSVAELTPDGIAVVDDEGRLLYANRTLRTMVGLDDSESWVGQPTDLVTQSSSEENAARRRPVIERGETTSGIELELRHSDGRLIPVEMNAAPFDLQGRPGVLSVLRDLTERRRSAVERAAVEARHRVTLDTVPDGVILYDVDADGRAHAVLANPAAEALLGLTLAQLQDLGAHSAGLQLLDEDGRAMTARHMPVVRVVDEGRAIEDLVWGLRRGQTPPVWIRSSTRPILDDDGTMTGIVSSLVDVTAERAAYDEIEAAHARYEALIEHGSDLITITDGHGILSYASPALRRVLGDDPTAAIGVFVFDRCHPDDRDRVRDELAPLIGHPGAVAYTHCRVRATDGTWKHLELSCANRLEDPAIGGFVTNARDVTERVQAAAQLAHQARHDQLTGLANRALLIERLHSALARSVRSGRPSALLFLDLDHFKRVNDTLGHPAGDQLLVTVAERLSAAMRPGDSVARFGGDEFVVLAEDVSSTAEAVDLAERLRDRVSQAISLDERCVTIGCSVGVAVSDGHRPDSLIQEADIALYRAKERGRGRSELYDTAMRALAHDQLDAEDLIRTAIEHDRLIVVYQPIIDLRQGVASGTEALARIIASDGSLVEPDLFIPAAEDSGLIIPLGAAILDQACAQQARWTAAGSALTTISVNLSARQLASEGLVTEIGESLRRWGVDPDRLCIELTESALIDAGSIARRGLDEIKAMGVRLALDDFGTGWSSLLYLRAFPVDAIKIDQTFVAGLGFDAENTEVVRAVISLGHALELTVIAEGVETAHQANQLIELGCDYAQGYFYSRPMLASELATPYQQPAPTWG